MKKQNLKQMIEQVLDGSFVIRCGLSGCPVGGWPKTQQAIAQLDSDLPSERSYDVMELIEALYVVDHADRYQFGENK